MRLKKQKRHRKVVRFYTTCFGFREPFKVLCDGTFVHHLLLNHITPADTALTNLLSGKAKLFTTRLMIRLYSYLAIGDISFTIQGVCLCLFFFFKYLNVFLYHQFCGCRCVHAELKSLGDSYSETFKASQNLITARLTLSNSPLPSL